MYRKMRRNERQLTNQEVITALEAGNYGVLSTVGPDGFPYGVPISYIYIDGCIFFHSAVEGHKLDNIRQNPQVSFCVVDRSKPLPTSFTNRFRSVIVFGKTEEISEAEKAHYAVEFVKRISKNFGDSGYHESETMRFAKRQLPNARMFKINIEHMTGKADLSPSCRDACPARVNIPGYIALIKAGRPEDAYRLIRQDNPFPAICGRICVHPCESNCIRHELDEPLSTRNLKRFAADCSLENMVKEPKEKARPNGKKVAIIGAGPSGLTCGYFLALLGYAVDIFEARDTAGGIPALAIPKYRLPGEILAQEISLIEQVGVNIHLNTEVKTGLKAMRDEFDAVYVSVGSHSAKRLGLPGEELPGVCGALDFLKAVKRNEKLCVEKDIVVLGGGSVAFDAARAAVRLGAKRVHVACLEARENMLATPDEIQEAEEEGVIVHNMQSFVRIAEESGKVCGVECLDVQSSYFDDSGSPHIITREGSRHILAAGAVIIAVGQKPADIDGLGLEMTSRGTIRVDDATFASAVDGIFAGGDVVRGSVSVISAIGDGKKAAQSIDKYLGGEGVLNKGPEIQIPAPERIESIGEDYRPKARQLSAEERKCSFAEVDLGFDHDSAIRECGRCLRCDR